MKRKLICIATSVVVCLLPDNNLFAQQSIKQLESRLWEDVPLFETQSTANRFLDEPYFTKLSDHEQQDVLLIVAIAALRDPRKTDRILWSNDFTKALRPLTHPKKTSFEHLALQIAYDSIFSSDEKAIHRKCLSLSVDDQASLVRVLGYNENWLSSPIITSVFRLVFKSDNSKTRDAEVEVARQCLTLRYLHAGKLFRSFVNSLLSSKETVSSKTAKEFLLAERAVGIEELGNLLEVQVGSRSSTQEAATSGDE